MWHEIENNQDRGGAGYVIEPFIFWNWSDIANYSSSNVNWDESSIGCFQSCLQQQSGSKVYNKHLYPWLWHWCHHNEIDFSMMRRQHKDNHVHPGHCMAESFFLSLEFWEVKEPGVSFIYLYFVRKGRWSVPENVHWLYSTFGTSQFFVLMYWSYDTGRHPVWYQYFAIPWYGLEPPWKLHARKIPQSSCSTAFFTTFVSGFCSFVGSFAFLS